MGLVCASKGEGRAMGDRGMVEGPAQTFPAAGGWRPGEGRGVQPVHRPKTENHAAERERAPEHAGRRGPDSRNKNQAVDILQARRHGHAQSEEDVGGSVILPLLNSKSDSHADSLTYVDMTLNFWKFK